MSENLFQFDQQQQQPLTDDSAAIGNIQDYLTCDLKLSDTAFADFFSEFDLTTDDFKCFDGSSNSVNYPPLVPQSSVPNVLPATFNPSLLSVPPTTDEINDNNGLVIEPQIDEFLSSNTLKLLLEQHQAQQALIKYSSSSPHAPPPSIQTTQTIYSEPTSTLPMDIFERHPVKLPAAVRKPPIAKRPRPPPPVHLPKLVKKPEPIPVTFDQFQALICATPESSATNAGTLSSLLEHSTIIGNNIPLKIVSQTTSNHYHSSDENSQHDMPTGNSTYQNSGHNGGGRVRRKSSHNAIEKRYRSSINERILELKDIVAVNDEKVQKSGVLRRTIEYIRQLESTNQRLEEENGTLKTILKRLNLTTVDFPTKVELSSTKTNPTVKNQPTTPPSSHGDDSGESTLGSSDEAFSPAPKRRKRAASKQGMVNGSRLVLCCFMLCVLVTNPFNYLLNLLHASDTISNTEMESIVGSRTLQAAANENTSSSEFLSASWRQLVAWMLNIAICLVCLVKLFVYGEPIIPESEMHEYYVYKKKADQHMAENQLNEARIYYRQCCQTLYAPIDTTLLHYLSSITWQMTRLCVNLISIGRWLTYWSGWTKSIDTRDYNRELNDCLRQLWKIEYQNLSSSSSSLALFNLFLSTINTEMSTGKKMDPLNRNEIYLLAALTLKYFDGIWLIFIPYVLKYIQIINMNDIWLTDIDRINQFIVEKSIKIKFEQQSMIESIHFQYLEYILNDNVRCLLQFQDDEQTLIRYETTDRLDRFSWWQHVLQIIRCISNDKQQSIDNIISSDILRQQVGHRNRTIYQNARSIRVVDDRFIAIVETIHSILLVLNDDDDQSTTIRLLLLEQLGQMSRLITSMVDTLNENDNLDVALLTLLTDGILSLRLRLLSSSITTENQSIPYLDDFQRELNIYKQLRRIMHLPKQRLYLFESVFRASSGLNPLLTQTLFERALKQPIKEESPNMDILAGLLLFCHLLPSAIFRYRNIFQRFINNTSTSNKNHDYHRQRQQCLTLMRQPYFTL